MNRTKQLTKNYSKIFWIEAFFYANVVNIISTLFYIARGLTLKQIFFLPIVYSVTNIIFEIPSSYLADKWGRKKTIILSCILLTINYILAIFAYNFFTFSLVVAFYAMSIAFLSGTSEALIYDTTLELKEKEHSLKRIASLHSAKHIFKVLTPLLAAILVKDLTETQFILIYSVNSIISISALFISFGITESNHFCDINKKKIGFLRDSIKSIKTNKKLIKVMLNRTIIFISLLITFLIFQKLFVDRGITIVTIGFIWSLAHATKYIITKNFTKIFPNITVHSFINRLNCITTLLYLASFLFLTILYNPLFSLICFALSTISVIIRNPVFSEHFNKNSRSFNRATTLSLLSFIKSALDIPVMLLSAFIVSYNINYIFLLAFILSAFASVVFRLDKTIKPVEKLT